MINMLPEIETTGNEELPVPMREESAYDADDENVPRPTLKEKAKGKKRSVPQNKQAAPKSKQAKTEMPDLGIYHPEYIQKKRDKDYNLPIDPKELEQLAKKVRPKRVQKQVDYFESSDYDSWSDTQESEPPHPMQDLTRYLKYRSAYRREYRQLMIKDGLWDKNDKPNYAEQRARDIRRFKEIQLEAYRSAAYDSEDETSEPEQKFDIRQVKIEYPNNGYAYPGGSGTQGMEVPDRKIKIELPIKNEYTNQDELENQGMEAQAMPEETVGTVQEGRVNPARVHFLCDRVQILESRMIDSFADMIRISDDDYA